MRHSISPLEKQHLPAVLKLSNELGYPTDLAALEERFKILNELTHHAVFVYSNDRGIVGFIHLEAVDDLIEERKVEIKTLVVDENERGNGIGAALVKKSSEWAKMYGLHTIYLSCNTLRNRTHKFYEDLGFKKIKTSHFYEIKVDGLH